MQRFEVKIAPPCEIFKVEANSETEAQDIAEALYLQKYEGKPCMEIRELVAV